MENGEPHGSRTDQDREDDANGAAAARNGHPSTTSDKVHDGQANPTTAGFLNGVKAPGGGAEAALRQNQPGQSSSKPSASGSRMNDLPAEIVHVTQGFVPLSLLLTRLAQSTHNSLQDKMIELAKMPAPPSAVNGNSTYPSNAPDDTTTENVRKKASLLTFMQDQHAKWVKALVISEWSRKSELVSKLIDLKFHIDQQRILYDNTLDDLVNVKRGLNFARMPSPDLKTALQVLSTGEAPWMPDLQYIEPPPLSIAEQAKWIGELNTLLSLRLNLDEYDKMPHQFRDYEISSGRVKFKVRGEFEVDLTIADEDPEKQFWFIDFRFAFSPSAAVVPASLRNYLEACTNESLGTGGLAGCFAFLHEFVLTSKVNELKRQALQLSRASWTGTLQIESLNRALAIQYWTTRMPAAGLKSWILVAIQSGTSPDGQNDPKSISRLVVKWYRDNKEVTDIEIPLDTDNLSTEKLLRTVIGHHVEFILASIRDKLLTAPRFKNREVGTLLHIDDADSAASSLTTQIGHNETISLSMEPHTGVFAVKPQNAKFTVSFEHQLNSGKNAAEDGLMCFENIRCGAVEDAINRQASVMDWRVVKPALNSEETRNLTDLRDWTRTIWLQRRGWGPTWFVVVFLSLGGDEWWLVEAIGQPRESNSSARPRDLASRGLQSRSRLPLGKGHPDFSDTFWNNLTIFATGMITQSSNLRELHRLRIRNRGIEARNSAVPQQIRLPRTAVELSAFLPSMVYEKAEVPVWANESQSRTNGDAGGARPRTKRSTSGTAIEPKQAWADNVIMINFQGVQLSAESREETGGDGPTLICISEAVVRALQPQKFANLQGMGGGDVSFNHDSGEFSLRMRHAAGVPMIAMLRARLRALDRFVTIIEAMRKVEGSIASESVTLREIVFSYREVDSGASEDTASGEPQRWRVRLDLSREVVAVELESNSPHARMVDVIQRMVNQDGGIGVLLKWLPASLPAMRTLDKMENRWAELRQQDRGKLGIFMRTMSWAVLQYELAGGRLLRLDMSIKMRRNQAMWHLRSSDHLADSSPEGGFDRILKPIWNSTGNGWQGLVTGAAANPHRGVVELLSAVDEAIQNLATSAASFDSYSAHAAASITSVEAAAPQSQSTVPSSTQRTTQPTQWSGTGDDVSQPLVLD